MNIKFRNSCVILLLSLAFTATVIKADGDVPIAGRQCDPVVRECPPCDFGEPCSGEGTRNRIAPAAPTPSSTQTPSTSGWNLIDELKKLFGF